METYIQTGLGIVVSVLLFLLGYRQTVGARKERIKSANEKIIDTILKRIILESYTPQKKDIKRLIEGKARDYKVKIKDLLSIDQIFNTLYTRIFENDLISKDEREANLERFESHYEKEKKVSKPELEISYGKTKDKNRKFFNIVVLLLGVISSIVGVSLVFFDKLSSFKLDDKFNLSIIGTMAASLISVYVVYIFLRFKDSQESSEESSGPKKSIIEYVKFEKDIQNQFKKLNVEYEIPSRPDSGFDLIANIKGEKTAIEIRSWKKRPPLSFIRRLIARMNIEMKQNGIPKGIIIVRNSFDLGENFRLTDNIQIMTISDLKKLLV